MKCYYQPEKECCGDEHNDVKICTGIQLVVASVPDGYYEHWHEDILRMIRCDYHMFDKGKPNRLLSKRLEVLLHIYEHQQILGHGVGFNDLVEISGFERATVSKCHDSLSDTGLVEDVWHTEDGMHSKVMAIPRGTLTFVKEMKETFDKHKNQKPKKFSTTIKKVYWEMKMVDLKRSHDGMFFEYKNTSDYWNNRLQYLSLQGYPIHGVFLVGNKPYYVRIHNIKKILTKDLPPRYQGGVITTEFCWQIQCSPNYEKTEEEFIKRIGGK